MSGTVYYFVLLVTMVVSCCAYGCSERFRKGSKITFHRAAMSNQRTEMRNLECMFCHRSTNDEVKFGQLYHVDGIVTHYYCMLMSCGLEQRGEDHEGILGFLAADVHKEIKRGEKLLCNYCRKPHATVGCYMKSCRKRFHYSCGIERGSMHQFFGLFRSFCPTHCMVQKIDPDIMEEAALSDSLCCPICMEPVSYQSGTQTLWAPCCKKNAWFHRTCVQQLALSAGYFFKCPLCNNKREFQKEMLKFGLYIPEKDASWELVPNAYQDLLYRYNQCDATTCKCPKGRSHNGIGTKYEIVLCEDCGSGGIHIHCGSLKFSAPTYKCKMCVEFAGRKAAEANNEELEQSPEQSQVLKRSLSEDISKDSTDSDEDVPMERTRKRFRRRADSSAARDTQAHSSTSASSSIIAALHLVKGSTQRSDVASSSQTKLTSIVPSKIPLSDSNVQTTSSPSASQTQSSSGIPLKQPTIPLDRVNPSICRVTPTTVNSSTSRAHSTSLNNCSTTSIPLYKLSPSTRYLPHSDVTSTRSNICMPSTSAIPILPLREPSKSNIPILPRCEPSTSNHIVNVTNKTESVKLNPPCSNVVATTKDDVYKKDLPNLCQTMPSTTDDVIISVTDSDSDGSDIDVVGVVPPLLKRVLTTTTGRAIPVVPLTNFPVCEEKNDVKVLTTKTGAKIEVFNLENQPDGDLSVLFPSTVTLQPTSFLSSLKKSLGHPVITPKQQENLHTAIALPVRMKSDNLAKILLPSNLSRSFNILGTSQPQSGPQWLTLPFTNQEMKSAVWNEEGTAECPNSSLAITKSIRCIQDTSTPPEVITIDDD